MNQDLIMVTKRDSRLEEYDGSKIVMAISRAMSEGSGVDKDIAHIIESEIYDFLCGTDGNVTIEEISDTVEHKLMEHAKYNTAKRYILHRDKRNQERLMGDEDLQSKYFSKEFLKQYKDAKEPFSPLGGFVKARTYARWVPEKKRRETWFETVKRAVEFNLSLAKVSQREAEQLFHNVFYLKQNLSGRMTWLGGTPTSHSNALGLFNCAFDIIDSFDVFVEGFTVLMLGAGLGTRITKADVSKIPKVRTKVEIIDKIYEPVTSSSRKEYTSLVEHSKNLVEIIIGDSRGAWTESLDMYFKLMYSVKYKDVDTILINYDNIRPAGLRIKGFGGKSSGFDSVKVMFNSIHSILTKNTESSKYKLKTIDVLDIMCHIALNVVSGNVRRSSLMILCEEDDYDIINAKNNMYTQENGEWKIDKTLEHRQMSNNTIIYRDKPARETFSNNFKKLRVTGEPATLVLDQALKRNPNAKGLNPCGRFLASRKKSGCIGES